MRKVNTNISSLIFNPEDSEIERSPDSAHLHEYS